MYLIWHNIILQVIATVHSFSVFFIFVFHFGCMSVHCVFKFPYLLPILSVGPEFFIWDIIFFHYTISILFFLKILNFLCIIFIFSFTFLNCFKVPVFICQFWVIYTNLFFSWFWVTFSHFFACLEIPHWKLGIAMVWCQLSNLMYF